LGLLEVRKIRIRTQGKERQSSECSGVAGGDPEETLKCLPAVGKV